MHLPNNTLLQGGKYKIVRFLSSGGFGCTYEAEHVTLRKSVAIKELFVKDVSVRDERTQTVSAYTTGKSALLGRIKHKFLEEAQALHSMQHPNIIKVHDAFEENGTAYYVMDYIKGKSINEILKEQDKIFEAKAVRYITQVANALQYVHSQNRLHLDIKPGNIMIDEYDNAILIDFGASKQYDEESGENTSTLLGKTPGYAPIEQIGNNVKTFTPATDIYSLGATLYKMLTGITPPEATVLVADGESLRSLPSHISATTQQAVKAAMHVSKKDRPQSVSVFINMLNGGVKTSNVRLKINDSRKGSGNSISVSYEPALTIGKFQSTIDKLVEEGEYKEAYSLCIQCIKNNDNVEYAKNTANKLIPLLKKQNASEGRKQVMLVTISSIIIMIVIILMAMFAN